MNLNDIKIRLDKAIDNFIDETKKLRTGRAHPSMLDGVMVTAYGTNMPLNQVSNITAPEAQLLQITPFDPNNIQAISEAIRNDQGLGLNPSDDGRVVRVPVPPLTTERRQEIVKQLNEKSENCHISCRNIRHDALNDAKKAKADKVISEDEFNKLEKQIEEEMKQTRLKVDKIVKEKEQELMTV